MDLDNPAWVYEPYQVPALFGRWARVLIDLASPAPGAHVLDAACGTGVVARMLAPVVGPDADCNRFTVFCARQAAWCWAFGASWRSRRPWART